MAVRMFIHIVEADRSRSAAPQEMKWQEKALWAHLGPITGLLSALSAMDGTLCGRRVKCENDDPQNLVLCSIKIVPMYFKYMSAVSRMPVIYVGREVNN